LRVGQLPGQLANFTVFERIARHPRLLAPPNYGLQNDACTCFSRDNLIFKLPVLTVFLINS
jgi:hypothetical protein